MTRRSPKRTQTHATTIELAGHRGNGSHFDIEVEFTISPHVAATYMQPAEGGEVEITRVRIIHPDKSADGRTQYRDDAPQWLLDLIEECVDTVVLGENAEPDDDRQDEDSER